MGFVSKVINVSILVGAIAIGLFVYFNQAPTLPDSFLQDHYWGDKPWKFGDIVPKDDPKVKPFKVNIPDSVLTDLESRLNRTRFPQALQGVNFEYGFNPDTLKKVVNYWVTTYDWRANEALINKYPNYKTQIEGIDIHYIHVKPDAKKAKLSVPLVLCHGWPGSVVEFLKIIPLLTNPGAKDDLAFELVIPSLPGYGFSDASKKPGLNAAHTARLFSKLMTRLGHAHFFFHGGDWGAFVGKFISLMYPNRVAGFHTTMPIAAFSGCNLVKIAIGEFFPGLIYENPSVDAEKLHPVAEKFTFLLRESGYMHLQSTKPDIIGTVLNDSPAGLAAYILEKFSTWTNPDLITDLNGGLLAGKNSKFTLDELLTNVMVYWVTGTITSSQRFYKENSGEFMMNTAQKIPVPSNVAVAASCFKHEFLCFPKELLKHTFPNIVQYRDHADGGHFAAFEVPSVVAADVRDFVSSQSSKLWWAQTPTST